jgi:hypothetical protein
MKVIGFLLILGSDMTFAFLARGTLNPRLSAQVWKMHEIDNIQNLTIHSGDVDQSKLEMLTMTLNPTFWVC